MNDKDDTASNSFNLRSIVRHVVQTTDLASPREIAEKVNEMVPHEHVREAFFDALVNYVRDELGRLRSRPRDLYDVTTESETGSGFNVLNSARSAKVMAIRRMWRRELYNRVHVGDAHWKLLGDCTYDDLQKMAEERRQHARANAAKAEFYAKLANLVKENHVSVVAELTDDSLSDIFGQSHEPDQPA